MLYTTLRIIFAVIFQLLFRAKTYGKENLPAEGPVILAANHMSNWDPPLLATFLPRPVSYMAKIELFEHPIFGAAIRRCHAFPVKRGAADRGAIKAAVNVLRQGRVLGLFPEGTRSKDGKLHKAEAGVGLLAAMSGAPVVRPVSSARTASCRKAASCQSSPSCTASRCISRAINATRSSLRPFRKKSWPISRPCAKKLKKFPKTICLTPSCMIY